MNPRDLEKILSQRLSCPSEWVMDRLHWKELSPAAESETRRHLAACPVCQQRLALRQTDFSALPELDTEALVTRIHRAVADLGSPERLGALLAELSSPGARPEPGPQAPSRAPALLGLTWRRIAQAAVAALALLIVAVLVVNRGQAPGTADSGIRAKGGLKLVVYRERAGQIEKAANNERFQPRDRLRFTVDLPWDGHTLIVGAESTGKLFVCFPSDGRAEAQPTPKGRDIPLPGAILLDDSRGQEWLYLVHCPRPFGLTSLRASGSAPGALEVPPGCIQRAFEVDKR
jgi:hypothetical protein